MGIYYSWAIFFCGSDMLLENRHGFVPHHDDFQKILFVILLRPVKSANRSFTALPMTCLFHISQLALYAGDDSPRQSALRGRRPSLRLRRKEGKKVNSKFQLPLSNEVEERDVKRSDDRVSLNLG
jgi:hypothetical protein